MSGWTIGILGGSGLYAIGGLQDAQWRWVDSPWGEPSDAILTGRIGHARVAFLPRHGRGHRIAPGEIDARSIWTHALPRVWILIATATRHEERDCSGERGFERGLRECGMR